MISCRRIAKEREPRLEKTGFLVWLDEGRQQDQTYEERPAAPQRKPVGGSSIFPPPFHACEQVPASHPFLLNRIAADNSTPPKKAPNPLRTPKTPTFSGRPFPGHLGQSGRAFARKR